MGSKALTWRQLQPRGMFSPVSGSPELFPACGNLIPAFQEGSFGVGFALSELTFFFFSPLGLETATCKLHLSA